MNTAPWPYPRWIAHRGGGTVAPENTLAAFREGARQGWRMAECDAKLSADGVAFLLHDATLERTTSGVGAAAHLTWAELSRLDAGAWHSPAYAGEPPPTLEAIARWTLANGQLLNIEIKPSPGQDRATGEAVAADADRLWQGAPVPPLLTSFKPEALQGAQSVAPRLPRGLLLDKPWDGWEAVAQALGCVALVANQNLWDEALVAVARARGWRCLAYTVNDPAMAERLLALGLDGLISDRIDSFDPRG